MGIEIVEHSEVRQLLTNVMEDMITSIYHVQSGTYNLGRHDLNWELVLIKEGIKVILKLYNTSLQTKILDRNIPSTVFKSDWGYGQLGIELGASFDYNDLVINRSI